MIDLYNLKGVPKEINSLLELVQECKSRGDNENAANYLKTAIEKAEYHKVAPSNIAHLYRLYSDFMYWLTRHLDLIKAAYSAISYLRMVADLENEMVVRMYLSNMFQEVGDFTSSLEELQEAQELSKLVDSPSASVWLKNTWAVYYSSVGECDRSINLNLEVLKDFEALGDLVSVGGTYHNIGSAYYRSNDCQKSIEYNLKALEIALTLDTEHYNTRRLLVTAKHSLAETYLKFNVFPEKALSLFLDALHDCQSFSLQHFEASIRTGLGRMYILYGDNNSAKAELIAAKGCLSPGVDLAREMTISAFLAQISRDEGNFNDAIKYYEEYCDLITKERENDKKQRSIELEIRLYRMEERRKNEILEKELQVKQKVNEAVAIHMKENEQFLTKLHKRLIDIEPLVNKKSKKEIVTLKNEIKDILLSKKEWTEFENGFLNAHSELEQKLLNKYPSLTLTERKVCIFLHSGRSTKEIASLLHISPDTVDTHRIHIRRKMGLAPRSSLRSLLSTL